MLTGKKCFEYIPDHLKQEFIDCTNATMYSSFDEYVKEEFFTVSSFIAKAFVWDESPSGAFVWAELCSSYRKIFK